MPQRACFVCKERGEKDFFLNLKKIEKNFIKDILNDIPENLEKIFKNTSSILCLDLYSKLPGKGINVCPKKSCLKETLKKLFKNKSVDIDTFIEFLIKNLEKEIITKLKRAKKAGLLLIGLDNISLKDKDDFLFVSSTISQKNKEKLKAHFKNFFEIDETDLSYLLGMENKNIKYILLKNTPLGKDIKKLLNLYIKLKQEK